MPCTLGNTDAIIMVTAITVIINCTNCRIGYLLLHNHPKFGLKTIILWIGWVNLLLFSPEHMDAFTWRADLAKIVQDGLTPMLTVDWASHVDSHTHTHTIG